MCVWVGGIFIEFHSLQYNLDCTLPDIYAFITALSDNPNFFLICYSLETKEVSEEEQTPVCFPSVHGVGGVSLNTNSMTMDFYRTEEDCSCTHLFRPGCTPFNTSYEVFWNFRTIYMGARNLVGIGLSYRPARLHRQAESIPGLLKSKEILSLECVQCKVDPRMHEK